MGCDMKEGSSGAPWILEFEEGLNGVDFYTNSVIHGPCVEGQRERSDVCGPYHGDAAKSLYDEVKDE